MKRKVFTDGNGSTAILVEGLGHYVPSKEVEELEERIAELKVQVYFLKNRVKDLEGAKVFAEKWEDEHDTKIAKCGFIEGYSSCWFEHYGTRPEQHSFDFSAEQYASRLRKANGDKQ